MRCARHVSPHLVVSTRRGPNVNPYRRLTVEPVKQYPPKFGKPCLSMAMHFFLAQAIATFSAPHPPSYVASVYIIVQCYCRYQDSQEASALPVPLVILI